MLGTDSKPFRGQKLILATETLGSNGTRGRRKRRESAVGLSLLASCWSSAQLFSCYSGTPRARLLRTHKEDPASIQGHNTRIIIDHKHTQNDHSICWNKSNTSTMHRRYLDVLSAVGLCSLCTGLLSEPRLFLWPTESSYQCTSQLWSPKLPAHCLDGPIRTNIVD